ncbi:MAG: hypothetical protein ABSF83_07085 [Nitrososphaerales archaeon]|jgi:hypothetical protein
MSRRTVQVHLPPVEEPSFAIDDLGVTTADIHSLPVWERVLMLALTYDPPAEDPKGAGSSKYSEKV